MNEKSSIPVRLFGYPEVDASSSALAFPARGFCLLALLALAPARTMTRSHAATRLWESQETQSSLANMRQLIFRMLRTMPSLSSILAVEEKSLKIVEPSQIDVCRFLDLDDLSTTKGVQNLMDLYRGDLLQGLDPSVMLSDDPFAAGRAYLRERYVGFVSIALKGLTRYGHAEVSLLQTVERHALSIDSSREEIYRALIAAYGAIGRADESRRVFALLTDVLRLEGTGPPDTVTRASLVRATARSIDLRPGPDEWRKDGVKLPRVALLAPNWVSTAWAGNFLRAFVEDTANELARHRSLVALASHSSFQANSDGGILLDNSALRADYTVSSFVRPGAGLEILTVRLVSSHSGAIIWAAEYPLHMEVIVCSNRSLIARIVSALSDAVERDSLACPGRTGEPSAYVKFLKAQHALKRCDLRSVRRAKRWFAEAIAEDNRFADAYSGVSCSLYLEWLLLGGNDSRLLAEAYDLAELAISHDPHNSVGYWRKAMVALYQHHFDDSEECFIRAQELHPNSADILLDHSDAMGFVGDAGQAWEAFERALDLNPTPPDHYWWAGASVAFSKADFSKAIELCGRLANDEPVLRLLAACHGQLGNLAEAREYGRRLVETYPGETAESMTRLQPHRSKADLQPFVDGLRVAGVK